MANCRGLNDVASVLLSLRVKKGLKPLINDWTVYEWFNLEPSSQKTSNSVG